MTIKQDCPPHHYVNGRCINRAARTDGNPEGITCNAREPRCCGQPPDKNLCVSCGDQRNWEGCGTRLPEPSPIVTGAELREALRRVNDMLDDPHPGLMTWTESFIGRLHKLKAVLDRACTGRGIVRL